MALTSRRRTERIFLLVAAICATTVFGCRKGNRYESEDDLNIQRQLCRDRQTLTIGFVSGGNIALLDACQPDINRSFSLSQKDANFRAFDYLGNTSPDGSWTVTIEQNELLVKSQAHRPFAIPLKASVRGQLKWSKDSRFFFYVTSENYDVKRPLLGCSDDAFDLHIASVESSTHALVGRLCSGVPFDSLRWLYQ